MSRCSLLGDRCSSIAARCSAIAARRSLLAARRSLLGLFRQHGTARVASSGQRVATSEQRFRGLERVDAADGILHLRWAGHELRIQLGKEAAKWAEKIRNPKSVVDKLGVKADSGSR